MHKNHYLNKMNKLRSPKAYPKYSRSNKVKLNITTSVTRYKPRVFRVRKERMYIYEIVQCWFNFQSLYTLKTWTACNTGDKCRSCHGWHARCKLWRQTVTTYIVGAEHKGVLFVALWVWMNQTPWRLENPGETGFIYECASRNPLKLHSHQIWASQFTTN